MWKVWSVVTFEKQVPFATNSKEKMVRVVNDQGKWLPLDKKIKNTKQAKNRIQRYKSNGIFQ